MNVLFVLLSLKETYSNISPTGVRNNVNVKNSPIKNNAMFMNWLSCCLILILGKKKQKTNLTCLPTTDLVERLVN